MNKTVICLLLICLPLLWTGKLYAGNTIKYQGGSYDGHAFAQSKRNTRRVHLRPGNTGYNLTSNYPNPFNSETRIIYWVSQTSLVTVKVFDITGKEIQGLINEVQTPGEHGINFKADHLAGGVYIYQIKINNEDIQYGKIVYIK